MNEESKRLLSAIMDNPPQDEPYHEHDCRLCDIAAEIVGSLGAYWDVNDTWWTESALGAHWPSGTTKAQQAEKIVAHVLHRQLPCRRIIT